MKATVVADASFRDGAHAGWAGAYIVLNETPVKFSGQLENVANSTHAELAALGNAICTTIKRGRLSRGDELTAYSDCKHAVSLLKGNVPAKGISAIDKMVVERVDEICAHSGVILKLKHVKGHSKAEDRISRLNEWCDLAAKAAQVSEPVVRPRRKCLKVANA